MEIFLLGFPKRKDIVLLLPEGIITLLSCELVPTFLIGNSHLRTPSVGSLQIQTGIGYTGNFLIIFCATIEFRNYLCSF